MRVALRSVLLLAIVHFCDRVSLCRVGDAFQKAYSEEWIHMGDDSSSNLGEQCMANIPTMVQGSEYKDLYENDHLLSCTSSTATCLIVRLCKNDSASTAVIQDLDRKEDAFEKQIAGKWHGITLQEAIEYVDHDILTNRFHVTHYGGCAVLFNKDTFYTNIEVKSLYLHDTRRELPDQVMEGNPGLVLQGVPHFADLFSAARKHLQFCPYILAISTPKKTVYCEKLILTIRANHDWSKD